MVRFGDCACRNRHTEFACPGWWYARVSAKSAATPLNKSSNHPDIVHVSECSALRLSAQMALPGMQPELGKPGWLQQASLPAGLRKTGCEHQGSIHDDIPIRRSGFDLHSGDNPDSHWSDCNIAVNPRCPHDTV